MITEDDLRRALQQDAYDVDVHAALRPPAVSHQRAVPAWVVATTAAVVVLLVVGVTLVATGVGRPAWFGGAVPRNAATVEPAVSGHSTGFVPRSRFDVNPLADLLATSRHFYPDRQDVWFEVPLAPSQPGVTEARTVGLVLAWEPGAFDEATATRGEAVQVAGRPGWYGTLTVPLDNSSTDRGPALVWQYAPGAWAVAFGLQPEHRTEAFERVLAGSVVARDSAVAIPVRIAAGPAGLVRRQLSISYDLLSGGAHPSAATTYGMTYSSSAGADGAGDYGVSVTVVPAAAAAADATATPDPTTPVPTPSSTDRVSLGTLQLDGRSYDIGVIHFDDQTQVDASARGARVSISIGWQDAVTPALDPAWLQFTPAASLDDPAAWFDGSVAFP